MAEVEVRNLTKRFGDTTAVEDVSFTIEDGELFALLGPSGCGKTTTLRCIAGLEYPSEGQIRIGGEEVTEMAPRHRNIAMVFQDLALYPHKTVRENMSFSLEMHGYDRGSIEERVTDAAATLEISELLDRYPSQLSGGQQQRVALGRAIVRDPGAFLMDEPLSSLDAKLREQMRAEILELHQEIDATILYVTHDQEVAMTLGDRIAIMDDGELQQVGAPREVYDRPASEFVAGFIGNPDMNFFDGAVRRTDGGSALDLGEFGIVVPDGDDRWDAIDGSTVRIGIRPQDIHHRDYVPRTFEEGEVVTGRVELLEELGSVNNVYLSTGESRFIACLTTALDVDIGDTIEVVFDTRRLHLFDVETGDRIEIREPASPGTPGAP